MPIHPDLKIFIVDDDVFCLTLYAQFLKNLGYDNITSFNSGEECLTGLGEQPALVFLDYNMEGMNGIEVLKRIKTFNPAIYVIIISGKGDAKVAAKAMEQHALDYIIKSSLSPDKMANLMQRVENMYTPKVKEAKKTFFEKVKAGLGI